MAVPVVIICLFYAMVYNVLQFPGGFLIEWWFVGVFLVIYDFFNLIYDFFNSIYDFFNSETVFGTRKAGMVMPAVIIYLFYGRVYSVL